MKIKYYWLGLVAVLALTTSLIAQSNTRSNNLGTKGERSVQAVVRDYFEWLYEAAENGTLRGNDVAPVATSDKSREFLRKKQDFLEVAEVNDTEYGVKMVKHDLTLKFVNLVYLDRMTASVNVLENYHRLYEYSDEFVDGTTTHQIGLVRVGRSWEIISDVVDGTDAPPDQLDKDATIAEIREQSVLRKAGEQDFLLRAGVTPEFLEEQRELLEKQGLNRDQVDGKLVELVNQKAAEYVFEKDSLDSFNLALLTNRSYNRQACQNYINSWWNRRNSSWGNFDNLGGDCTNWISQIIYAGGIPKDSADSYKWYYNSMNDRSSSWSGVNELWAYLVGNSANNGYNGPQASLWTDSSGVANMYTGDLIQLKMGSVWHHSYGVHSTAWVKQCPWYNPLCGIYVLKIYVTSHTSDRKADDIDRSDVAGAYPTRRYAHIVGWRSR